MATIARTSVIDGDLNPDFLEWQSSLDIDHRLLREDVEGSLAHIQVLLAAKLLEQSDAETLTRALEGLPNKVEAGDVVLPKEEDIHMAIESWLRTEIGEVADRLHTARSRNDQVAVDMKLWCRKARVQLGSAIQRVLFAVEKWNKEYGEVAMPCYTHRQVALPIQAQVWTNAALSLPLKRDLRWLDHLDEELRSCPLGAASIAGSTLPIDPRIAAEQLGFASRFENSIDAVGDRDYLCTLVFICSRIGIHLSRFCGDVVEFASDNLLVIGSAIACGSSMMPHKRNPDLFELVRAQAAMRQGDLVGIMGLFHGLGSGYHRDLQLDKTVVFRAFDQTMECLRMIDLGVRHLQCNQEVCSQTLSRNDAIATDLCETLVRLGMPFRQAYGKIGRLVAQQRSCGKRLMDLQVSDLETVGLPLELLERLDVKRSAEVHTGVQL